MLSSNVVKIKSDTIEQAVEQFLKQKYQRNVNTYRNYLVDIEHFFQSMFGKHYSFATKDELNQVANIDGLMTYFDNLYEVKNKSGKRMFTNVTINRKQSSIKALLKFLKIKKVYDHDLTELELIRNLPKDTKSIEVISFDTAMKYAEWIKENEKVKANEKYIIVKLAIDSGLRASELLSLKWNQFEEDLDCVVMRGRGKGNKEWIEKISLQFYEEILTLKGNSEHVFSLNYDNLVRMMNRVKDAFGVSDKNISFHSFKKCSVTSAYRLTGDILEAQRKGRHSSLDTTRLYTESEDYGITGLISLGDNIQTDLYKNVNKKTLVKAIELMNKDFIYILNNKIAELQK